MHSSLDNARGTLRKIMARKWSIQIFQVIINKNIAHTSKLSRYVYAKKCQNLQRKYLPSPEI